MCQPPTTQKTFTRSLYILEGCLQSLHNASPVLEELGGTLYLQEASYTAKCESTLMTLAVNCMCHAGKQTPFTQQNSWKKHEKMVPQNGPQSTSTYQHTHREGWMVGGHRTVLCWVPVPQLTMVVSSVAFLFYLPTNNPQADS
jgi:hypothetical protein